MTLFGLFRRSNVPPSAQTAKDRLQVLLAHERQDRLRPDYLPLLRQDILEVIRKYVHVPGENVEVKFLRRDQISMLEIEIAVELPGPRASTAKSAGVAPRSAFAG